MSSKKDRPVYCYKCSHSIDEHTTVYPYPCKKITMDYEVTVRFMFFPFLNFTQKIDVACKCNHYTPKQKIITEILPK